MQEACALALISAVSGQVPNLRSVGVVLVEDVADEEAQHAGIVADGLDEAVSLVADEFIVRALNAVADEVQDFGIGVKEVDERNSALDVLGGCGDGGDRRLHSAGRHGAVAEGNAGDVIAAKLTFGDVAAGLCAGSVSIARMSFSPTESAPVTASVGK